MRTVNEKFETIDESMINPDYGEIYQATIIKPDAVAPDHMVKHAYYDDDYEDVIVFRKWSDQEYIQKQIMEYKQKLAKTDYVVIKIAEGAAMNGEYDDILEMRRSMRDKINELQTRLYTMSS